MNFYEHAVTYCTLHVTPEFSHCFRVKANPISYGYIPLQTEIFFLWATLEMEEQEKIPSMHCIHQHHGCDRSAKQIFAIIKI